VSSSASTVPTRLLATRSGPKTNGSGLSVSCSGNARVQPPWPLLVDRAKGLSRLAARFHSIVAAIAARLSQKGNATGCTGT
jgi:hypothetical protein